MFHVLAKDFLPAMTSMRCGCRRQEEFERALDECCIRREPLGWDRKHRCYWWGVAGERAVIYVQDWNGHMGAMSTPEELDALMDALEPRGVREHGLQSALEKVASPLLTLCDVSHMCIPPMLPALAASASCNLLMGSCVPWRPGAYQTWAAAGPGGAGASLFFTVSPSLWDNPPCTELHATRREPAAAACRC